MSDLFGNHIVGFPTRRLKYKEYNYTCSRLRDMQQKIGSSKLSDTTSNILKQGQYYRIHDCYLSNIGTSDANIL